jgi:hypothetical protein
VGFTWSLAGQQCARAGVDLVHITIPGEALLNDGYYPCQANGVMGVVLHDFAPGTYSFTLEGLAPDNSVRYRGGGSFRVDGNVSVHEDMDPLAAVVNLTWRFPGNASAPTNPTCEEAFVSWMAIYVDDEPVMVNVDGQASEWIPCNWGQSQEGFSISVPAGGDHTLTVYASDDNGYVFYEHVGTVRAAMGQVVATDLPMQWAVGEAAVRWVLKSGGMTLTCAEAGVTDIYVQMVASNGANVFPGEGDRWACDDEEMGVVYDYMYPGSYEVQVKAEEDGDTTFRSDVEATPLLPVEAGRFTDGENPLVVPLYEIL